MLHIFYNGYKCVFLVFQTYVTTGSDVCCNCFHLDVVKVNLSVVHVVVEPVCTSHPPQLLGPPTYVWVWRGHHDAGTGHEAAQATVWGAGHGAARAPT
jgi:hypothetical protein